jgi:hypothetical protein
MIPVLLAVCACRVDRTPVDEGEAIELLETENRAPEVPADADDATPESIVFESGFDATQLLFWTHARAFVHADPAEVWEALREPEVMADRRVLTGWEVTNEDHIAYVDYSFEIQNAMSIEFANIEFELTWMHQAIEADDAGPTLVLARWDKTGGPPFIDRLSGSIEIESVAPGVSEIRGISHLRSVRRDAEAMEQYWVDLHDEITALVDGEPLPEYEPPGP